MYKEIVNKIKPELDKVISFFDGELLKIRTSRASPVLVEDIGVECFGNSYLLKQLSAISCPQSNQIVIQPWDKSYIEPIEKAISRSGLGLSPIVDKDIIRVNLPSLSEEYRKNLIKCLGEKAEQSKKTIRYWRDKSWDEIQKAFQEKKIREDDKFRGKDELQEIIDEYNEKVEKMVEKKRKEILE